MGSFVPNTAAQQQEMLHAAGYAGWDELFAGLPQGVRLQGALDLPAGMSELEAGRHLEELAEKNVRYRHIFRGAGAYDHYIPAIVGRVTRKETFLTAYTPYQAEISQGVLQSIFEYQSMICTLTGMDTANASVYDGAAAAAEAAAMCEDKKRGVVLAAATVPPEVRRVIETYCFGRGTEYREVPAKDGTVDLAALESMLGADTACLILAQPNYFGVLEPAREAGALCHAAGAKFVMSCNPISLGLLETPAACGADVAVGEGQPLGMPLSWGGPYLGYMAATAAMMRRLPGRIVGETTDAEGRRAYVLTLQAREQHIRREKAGSNICSNEALCALTAAVYLAAEGPDGLRETASQCCAKAHYLQKQLAAAGLAPVYGRPFFHEFVTRCADADGVLAALAAHGILGGLPLGGGQILWCATEKNTKAEMDEAAALAKEVLG